MNTRRLTLSAALVGAASLSLLPGSSQAQTTATTDPVGYTTSSLPANSDTFVSIPFTRPAAFTGLVSSVNGNTITLGGTPGFTGNQYVYAAGTQSNTYYAIVGPLNAALSGTLSATNGSKTLTGSGTTFGTDVKAGDSLTVNGAVYTVASVESASSLTLDKVYAGTTAAGLSATFDHSPKEGSYYTVTANGSNTLTVELNGDSLSSVAANTSVSLIPYWTLGTAFPASDANVSYVPSASAFSRGTQILIPDLVSTGINLAPKTIYYSLNGTWRISGNTSYNDTILLPTTYFIVRNPATATTTFTPTGSVYMNRLTVPLATQAGGAQDNAVAINRPAGMTLNELGLIASGAFTPSPTAFSRADQLLTFDNSVVGINKAASGVFYYLNGMWRQTNVSGDVGSTVIPYGTGFTIRKATNANALTSFWQNARNY